MAGEEVKKRKFPGHQVELLSSEMGLMAPWVDAEIPALDRFVGDLPRRPPKHRFDAGGQLVKVEGLRDVVVATELQTAHPVGLLSAGGHENDRCRAVLANRAAEVVAGALRQHDVEEYEIGANALVEPHPLLGGVRREG